MSKRDLAEELRFEVDKQRARYYHMIAKVDDAVTVAEAEIERLREQLAEEEAGAAALREALEIQSEMFNLASENKEVLSTTAGAAMLERMRKLEAVVDALQEHRSECVCLDCAPKDISKWRREMCDNDCPLGNLDAALAALDERGDGNGGN